ncbi:MAG: glycosyltransferase family 39 protein [Verrucomicrobiota bacterium]
MLRYSPLLFWTLVALTGLRLLAGGLWELSPAEALHWQNSLSPAWAYFEGSPAFAGLLWLSRQLFGEAEWALRLPGPLLLFASSLWLFDLGRKLADELAAALAVALLNLVPLANGHALLATPTLLCTSALFAFLKCSWDALQQSRPWNPAWPLAGLSLGLATLTHSECLWLLPLLLGLLAADRRWRYHFRQPGLALLIGLVLLLWLPQALAQAAFPQAPRDPPAWGRWLSLQVMAWTPWILLGILFALGQTLLSGRLSLPARFLLAFLLPLLAISLLRPSFSSLSALSLGSLWAASAWNRWQAQPVWKDWLRRAVFAWALLSSLGPLLSDFLRQEGLAWPHERDPTQGLKGWRALAGDPRLAAPDHFLIAETPGLAAVLTYYRLRENGQASSPVQLRQSPLPRGQASFLPRYDAKTGGERPGSQALYLSLESEIPASLRYQFASVRPLGELRITRAEQALRTVKIFSCQDFQPSPL